ncbi:MAG: mannose-6-phosphate isomerase, class I [Candidatus Aminicenantaceae bacterium]
MTNNKTSLLLKDIFHKNITPLKSSKDYGTQFHRAVIALEQFTDHHPEWEQSIRQSKKMSGIKLHSTEDKIIDDVIKTVQIKRNIKLTWNLIKEKKVPSIIGTVGNVSSQPFWNTIMNKAAKSFGSLKGVSLQEDLPTNQAFGLLYMYHNLKQKLSLYEKAISDFDALFAFVFGSGTRSTPFTETDCGQKPSIQGTVKLDHRYITVVELAMMHYISIQQYLKRSGFKGMVIKWGDEIQIPVIDLSRTDDLFKNADIVRFVNIREINTINAKHKDWVGVDQDGGVTMFIPRRPLEQMKKLADEGHIYKKKGTLFGGINLGSIAVSYELLEALFNEFKNEIFDKKADREKRPDLDPQFFTAICIALIKDENKRHTEWTKAKQTVKAIKKLADDMGDQIIERLRKVIDHFEQKHSRTVKSVAMNVKDLYWSDIGQHSHMFSFFMGINKEGFEGEIARALTGIKKLEDLKKDTHGNVFIGKSEVSPEIKTHNSILINSKIRGKGTISNCVFVETDTMDARAQMAFSYHSTAPSMILESYSGIYKILSNSPVHMKNGMRGTTLIIPDKGKHLEQGLHLMQVHENDNLRDNNIYGKQQKDGTWPKPLYENKVTFAQAHSDMMNVSYKNLQIKRNEIKEKLRKQLKIIQKFRYAPVPMITQCPCMFYHWGNTEFIPELIQISNPKKKPHAELWMGAHPSAPAKIFIEKSEINFLDLINGASEEILGKEISKKFENKLPYLFKVLTAEKALSLQTHPDKKQAKKGFISENAKGIPFHSPLRNYKDINPKTELICALNYFWVLVNFRKIEDIIISLRQLGLKDITNEIDTLEKEIKQAKGNILLRTQALKKFFSYLMNKDDSFQKNIVLETVSKVKQYLASNLNPSSTDDFREIIHAAEKNNQVDEFKKELWILRLQHQFSFNIGILAPLLFNIIRLKPGQALYLEAGSPHSYLGKLNPEAKNEGAGIELMSNSDNVLRGGLTSKHVDITEFLKILNFNSTYPEIITPPQSSSYEKIYKTPAEEFKLSIIKLKNHQKYSSKNSHSADSFIVINGQIKVYDQKGKLSLVATRGNTFIIPAASNQYIIEAVSPTSELYKASVPLI